MATPSDTDLLLQPWIPRLRRYARALVGDAVLADDLVQDCLERAIARWSQRRNDTSLQPWLFAILHNLAISHFRRTGRRGPHLDVESMDAGRLASRATQEDGLVQADLLRAVARLPADQRATILLVGVEGLSYAETARVTEVPIGTVMSRLGRARDNLARILADSGGETVRPTLRRVK